MTGKRVIAVVVLIGAIAGGTSWWFRTEHPEAPSVSVSIDRPVPDPVMSRVLNSGPMARPRDFFQCITQPRYLGVVDAAGSMSDDEVVVGLDVAGDSRAYPINYLNDHEMVEDEIGGLPLLVTW